MFKVKPIISVSPCGKCVIIKIPSDSSLYRFVLGDNRNYHILNEKPIISLFPWRKFINNYLMNDTFLYLYFYTGCNTMIQLHCSRCLRNHCNKKNAFQRKIRLSLIVNIIFLLMLFHSISTTNMVPRTNISVRL